MPPSDAIPIFARRDWQMSPGDRAALEGVVSSVAPALAIEVGSAQGGSLERIAAHSGRVHAFDLERPPAVPPNVEFHEGDSRELLPRTLAELDGEVGFAHVDGDHSTEGTSADLLALLDSPRVTATTILAHDSFHPPVRAAIDAAARHPKVTYADLDFVPGRMIDGGPFGDQMWGGFGILLVGLAAPQASAFDLELSYLDAYETAHRASAQLRPPGRLARLLGR